MNDYGQRWMLEKMRERDERRGRDNRDNRDYEDYEDYEDERRGVRGSGRQNRRGRDMRDYNDDYDDYHDKPKMRLTKADKNHWKHKLENTDGTTGEHFDMQEVMQAAEKLNVKFKDYSEKDFCLITNVMYSDYGHIIKRLVPPEKEVLICADMAKAYFDDPDGPEPEEKLAIHYHCMTNLG